jgi:hypothetical protein
MNDISLCHTNIPEKELDTDSSLVYFISFDKVNINNNIPKKI